MLDGAETLKICVGYKMDGKVSDILPVGAEELALCVPEYEEMPGWQESTVGVKAHDKLPKAARAYLARIGSECFRDNNSRCGNRDYASRDASSRCSNRPGGEYAHRMVGLPEPS